MKFSIYFLVVIVAALCFTFVQAAEEEKKDPDNFTIQFFKKPNYKEEAGIIGGSIAPCSRGQAKKGNMTVGSFTATHFLEVILFEEPYFTGIAHVYRESQKNLTPPLKVRSVRYHRIDNANLLPSSSNEV